MCAMPLSCKSPGCKTQPCFGAPGSSRSQAMFCSLHRTPGMVDVKNTACSFAGCFKRAYHGFGVSSGDRFCGTHKKPGMFDVISKRCEADGCKLQPSFGVAGSGKPGARFCASHKAAHMVNVVSRRCDFKGCFKMPSFGFPGSKRAPFCGTHKMPGMVNVRDRQCVSPGCTKTPSFDDASCVRYAPRFCLTHKMPHMVNIKNLRNNLASAPRAAVGNCPAPPPAGSVACAHAGCYKIPKYGHLSDNGSVVRAPFCAAHSPYIMSPRGYVSDLAIPIAPGDKRRAVDCDGARARKHARV